jgi:formylglycine-generating enzyme required for sulfatase activity
MTSPVQRHQLFISYSHRDREWVDRLQTMIRPLVRSDDLKLWDDSQIPPGARWKEEIEKALASAKVALLLVSDEFLASEFVTNKELPPLLEAAEREGLRILWVCLSPCFVEFTLINDFQAVIPPSQVLEGMTPVEQKQALKKLALSVREALSSSSSAPPVPPTSSTTPTATSPPNTSTPGAGEMVQGSSGRSEGAPWPLQPLRSTSCLILREANRWRQQRTTVEVQGYQEELAPGVAITMLRIPAGTYLMGSPEKEEGRSDDEGPQHQVTVREFFLGQTPITQAQWKLVADWEKVELDLNNDPAVFKGSNRPVEQVNWQEAMEFCRRLSRRTGKRYGLPSEAQWEYACRAGTTTPFHFGTTLTAELANYDATATYGDGPKGTYREQTTDVGTFLANAWGLQDMHGNVWEWCEDHWHDTYDFAPEDDQPWLIPAAGNDSKRLLRGGSWPQPRALPLGLPERRPPGLPQPQQRFPRLLSPPRIFFLIS